MYMLQKFLTFLDGVLPGMQWWAMRTRDWVDIGGEPRGPHRPHHQKLGIDVAMSHLQMR